MIFASFGVQAWVPRVARAIGSRKTCRALHFSQQSTVPYEQRELIRCAIFFEFLIYAHGIVVIETLKRGREPVDRRFHVVVAAKCRFTH